MQKIYNTAIIGGGAAGLMSAVELLQGNDSLNGEDVIILERADRVGKKLIATGNGQGNLTNAIVSEENYYGDDKFIADFLVHLKTINLKNYLFDIGIPLITTKDGKIYPISKQASSVLDVIRAFLSSKRVEEKTQMHVKKILARQNFFEIYSDSEKILAKTVILATGGSAQKQFGTDGTSYLLAENFGHKTTQLYPSLVQLKTDTEKIRGLKGLKEIVRVTAMKDGKEIKTAVGDLLFTEYGVSGSAIFSVSACVCDKQNVSLMIEFLPDYTIDEITSIIDNRLKLGYMKKEDVLSGLLVKRVGQAVLKTAKGNSSQSIAEAVKNFSLKVTGNLGFNYAQVTKGGIETKCIDGKTYESKLQKNLYVVGEMLDIDGDCGGYNLTFAFSSGITAAKSIKTKFANGEIE